MLITFKSRASPDVLMLADLANYLLGIVGKHLGSRGVIARHELPDVIDRMEAAIAEDQRTSDEHDEMHYGAQTGVRERNAGLAQRAYPFLDMLREAQKQDVDIIWGL
jgi:Domain of unknown function (DUF1840)